MRMALYRLYDVDNLLLYVGISNDPHGRALSHVRKHWGARVHHKTVEWLDRELAAIVSYETEVIKSERPVYNIRQADWIAVRDKATGEITFAPSPVIPTDQVTSVAARMSKAERDGASKNLPEGQSLARYLRACARALQQDPSRALRLVEEYWPVDPATVIPIARERVPTWPASPPSAAK